jgi:hypothetical protein
MTQINKIRDEKGTSRQIPTKFRRSLRNTLKSYNLIKWKNIEEMHKF